MANEENAQVKPAAKGTQVSCVLTDEELAQFEDYRFGIQAAERRDVKRSDVVKEALAAFFAGK